MNFCAKCDNMYYIKLKEDDQLNKLIYSCRQCNYEDDDLVDKPLICISKSYINKKPGNYKDIVNEYTKLDPTLPQVKNIKCPNDTCKSITNPEIPSNITYIKYNETEMKYLYMCRYCGQKWKNN